MFLKFRVKAAIAKFIYMNGLNAQTLVLFEHGAIDGFMPIINQRRFDANQGAVAVITGTITNAAQNGTLIDLKSRMPNIYNDLVVLWQFCGSLLAEDEQRWGNAVIVGGIDSNPFEYADKNA